MQKWQITTFDDVSILHNFKVFSTAGLKGLGTSLEFLQQS